MWTPMLETYTESLVTSLPTVHLCTIPEEDLDSRGELCHTL